MSYPSELMQPAHLRLRSTHGACHTGKGKKSTVRAKQIFSTYKHMQQTYLVPYFESADQILQVRTTQNKDFL